MPLKNIAHTDTATNNFFFIKIPLSASCFGSLGRFSHIIPTLRILIKGASQKCYNSKPAGGLVILSALRNAAKGAAFMLAAVAAKDAALEYRNDAPWNTKPPAPK
jgi:hypothetical protein